MERVYSQYWMSLEKPIREQLVKDFNMVRTGHVDVLNETVLTDGYNNDDLQVFTVESMEAYVGSSESFSRLWELTIAKAKSIINPPVMEIKIDGVIESLNAPIEVSPETLEVATEPRYCETCTSNGGRHKKGCPQYR